MPRKLDGTVYLVEDDDSVRDALRRLLVDRGCRVKAFTSAEDFLAADRNASPACALLDVRLPGISGLKLQDELMGSNLPIVFMTGHGDVPMAVGAIKKGAFDFLTKPVDAVDLQDAVAGALERHHHTRDRQTAENEARKLIADLTPRELEVLQLVITGAANKIIADKLGIAVKTVKIHRGNMNAKLGADSVVDLVHLADLAGVVPHTG